MFWALPQHALNNLFPVAWNPYHIFGPRELISYIQTTKLTMIRGFTQEKKTACLLLWVLIVDKWNCNKLGKDNPYSEDEYTIGRGEMVDLFILLMSPAISCSSKYLYILL